MLSIRRWLNRRTTNELCVQAIRLHRIIDKLDLPGIDDSGGTAFYHGLLGKLSGIRMGICALNGWDLYRDADKEGPADELVEAYWEKTYPQDWEIPT